MGGDEDDYGEEEYGDEEGATAGKKGGKLKVQEEEFDFMWELLQSNNLSIYWIKNIFIIKLSNILVIHIYIPE